jgi:mono/diheme cytochrome c family protein
MPMKKWVLSCCLVAVIGLSLGNGCPPSTSIVGNVANGQTLFSQQCFTCHTVAFLKAQADDIISNLGSLNAAMSGLTLTTQQIADLQAFLATQ